LLTQVKPVSRQTTFIVHESVKEKWVECCREQLTKAYGATLGEQKSSSHLAHIVNARHTARIKALLDDALGRTRHLTGRNCVTGSLNITYKRPTPLNADLLVNARIDEIHERKFIVSGEITYDGDVTASAIGVFVFLDTEKFNALVSDARSASR